MERLGRIWEHYRLSFVILGETIQAPVPQVQSLYALIAISFFSEALESLDEGALRPFGLPVSGKSFQPGVHGHLVLHISSQKLPSV